MLTSFHIKNYKNLKELRLDSLNRINLISGKPNTGKSSLLEAISIYANKGSIESIIANLDDRKEYFKSNFSTPESQQENIKILSSLFFNRKVSFNASDKIEIGCPGSKDYLTLRFVAYNEKEERTEDNEISFKRVIIGNDATEIEEGSFIGFEIRVGENLRMLSLQKNLRNYTRQSSDLTNNNQFIHPNNINKDINSLLFDRIALSDKKQYVIEALKIIEPKTERIAFIDNNLKKRVPVIKLSDAKNVVYLSSMGDGINRILNIILALVNSKDGYLLIDEFENGLHYTVQEQLWKIIFRLSTELNVQIFATTHSNDCIASFGQVLKKTNHKSTGKYIRLDNINGEIKQMGFSSEELDIAEQQDIEIR